MYYTEMQRERRETQQEEAEALVQADHTPRASDNIEGTKSRPIENRSGAEDSLKAVQIFCGFVNYLAKFLPHLAEVMEPIQHLIRMDTSWQWKH